MALNLFCDTQEVPEKGAQAHNGLQSWVFIDSLLSLLDIDWHDHFQKPVLQSRHWSTMPLDAPSSSTTTSACFLFSRCQNYDIHWLSFFKKSEIERIVIFLPRQVTRCKLHRGHIKPKVTGMLQISFLKWYGNPPKLWAKLGIKIMPCDSKSIDYSLQRRRKYKT